MDPRDKARIIDSHNRLAKQANELMDQSTTEQREGKYLAAIKHGLMALVLYHEAARTFRY